MKISLITTILNEEKTVEDFLKSVLKQSKKPDEFVIIDGGSKDKTYEILGKYAEKYKWIKIFKVSGATIGRGRNYAIEKSKNEIVAVTDAGCLLHKDWLKNITKPFERKNIDTVIGIYKPYYTNDFEYFQGSILVANQDKIFMNPSRMSSRSIAFTKSVFKKAGRYPDLRTGEDTKLMLNLVENHAKFEFAKNAVVYWKMRKTWKQFFKQFYNYGRGDRLSGNIWQMRKNSIFVVCFYGYFITMIALGFVNWIYSFGLLSLVLLISLLKGFQLALKCKKAKGVFYGFALNLIRRIAYAIGVSGI